MVRKSSTVEARQRFAEARALGSTIRAASTYSNISYATGCRWDKAAKAARGEPTGRMKHEKALSEEAVRALEDFGYFRYRYFGRVASPWQEEAAYKMLTLLESDQREFVVVNCPPGSGKSTLFTHDIPAWLTVRNRSLRGLIGSRSEKQSRVYVGRLKKTFERTQRVQAQSDLLIKGRAFDAESTLSRDYGSFKPENPDVWRRDEFTVAQFNEQLTDEKEPTWTGFGMDSASLGWRVNFAVWDDVVDKTTLRTIEAKENQRSWWEDEAETRLEPDGVLVLQGQRMAADDLYRHALNMVTEEVDDEGDTLSEGRKYTHIVYQAHYEDLCKQEHKTTAPAYPEGCLLDPVRLPWRELASIEKNRASKYRVVYQQEDMDPASVLVEKAWITGGLDSSGFLAPGCWDTERGLWEIPKALSGEKFVIATADPSPTRFWAVEAWLYQPDTEFRFLLDLLKQTMDAPTFLDWNHQDGVFSGIMDEWQQISEDMGLPIRYWIVESNAAQRFLLQYDHVRRWIAKRGVQIIAHQTHRNKADATFGVQTIAPHYQHGRVRLPGKGMARLASMKLVEEVTRWPEGGSDDCVMAHWFMEWNLPRIYTPEVDSTPLWRPSWVRNQQPYAEV